MAIQITAMHGGIPVAVASSEERANLCEKLGAKGTIDRRNFHHWGQLPGFDDGAAWLREARRFGEKFWEIVGSRTAPKIVLEHSGEDTIPTSR